MPKGTKIADCVEQVMAKGHSKPSAIRICQASTGMSYQTGKPSKAARARKRLAKAMRKHKR